MDFLGVFLCFLRIPTPVDLHYRNLEHSNPTPKSENEMISLENKKIEALCQCRLTCSRPVGTYFILKDKRFFAMQLPLQKYKKIYGVTCTTLAATIAQCICLRASAAINFFDDTAAFNAGLLNHPLSKYTQTFQTYTGAAAEFSGGANEYAWIASAANGLFGEADLIRTINPSDTLKFQFTPGAVYAVGGLFHYTNNAGDFLGGVMKVELNNGDVFVRSIENENIFTGFESDGDSILSLELSHFQTTTPTDFSAVTSFILGYKNTVPTPGVTAFLLMAGIATTRRRRNEHTVESRPVKKV